ncbi:MAG TPA: hypothetical protein VHC39_10070 [Rhizomicrobium sp.]|nr:hypothetical protein [Rhizomicrobium sp.]
MPQKNGGKPGFFARGFHFLESAAGDHANHMQALSRSVFDFGRKKPPKNGGFADFF